MSEFIVWIDVHLWPGNQGGFLKIAETAARASVTEATGCRRFDIVEPAGPPNTLLLYKVFSDRTAYDAHLASVHHRDFLAASEPLCASMTVSTGRLVNGTGN